jgi:NAD(P)-dependent dehydrogenase (short-subunit alcohol dehydrogenase family)
MTPILPISSLLDFRGKTALVTGAGSGIGAGIARRFAEAGARVVVHYRTSQAQAEAVASEINHSGGQALAVQADLMVEGDVTQLFEVAHTAFGRLDVLINNAGTYPLHSLLEMTAQQWDEVVSANLRSAFLCTQAFARQAIAAASGGAIVNITSIEAENPAPMHSHYNASKAGLLMLTRASAGELGAHGIRVNAVAPGLIWREGIEQAWPDGVQRYIQAAPLQRLGQPDDVADACLFLASPASRWITGASLTVDGGVMTHQVF